MRTANLVWLAILLGGCSDAADRSACTSLCDRLVSECRYEAYPSYSSCEQGCGYEASEGGSVVSMAECVEEAECETFAILECQHAFGFEQD